VYRIILALFLLLVVATAAAEGQGPKPAEGRATKPAEGRATKPAEGRAPNQSLEIHRWSEWKEPPPTKHFYDYLLDPVEAWKAFKETPGQALLGLAVGIVIGILGLMYQKWKTDVLAQQSSPPTAPNSSPPTAPNSSPPTAQQSSPPN
jgi:hypothetical protein